jgi:lysyl-tRNA synthetase, class II
LLRLSGNEKLIFDMVSKNSPMDLNDLKTRSGLSGKQWDIAMKALSKSGLTKVTKTEEGLTVEVVG